MYLNFFQLDKKPFSLAPDPEFLYLSQQHKDALGAIVYGIREREGFVSIVGEVGTGKTTIVRSFLNKTGRNKILPVFIFNSKLTFPELLETFLREIGVDLESLQPKYNVNDMVRLAYKAMLDKTRQGKNLVLIIDEAQNMPVETLGKLCILSNFETAKAKLIQIVLVGQPELQKKLDLYALRQLRQRIAYRAFIRPLSTKDSIGYIHHRLSLSSKGEGQVFAENALNRIVKHAKGVPRVINILCENSMVAGYGLQKKPVSSKLVKQVVDEYEGKRISVHFQFKKVAGSFLVIILTVLFVASYLPSQANLPQQLLEDLVSLKELPTSAQQPAGSNDNDTPSGKIVVEPIETETASQRDAQEITAFSELSSEDPLIESFHPQIDRPLTMTNLPGILRELYTSVTGEKSAQLEKSPTTTREPVHLKVAQKGDTVSKLFLETYGFYNSQALEWIKRHNPHITDMDRIQIDQIIYFPEIAP
jgi:general secretion pathway protein A